MGDPEPAGSWGLERWLSWREEPWTSPLVSFSYEHSRIQETVGPALPGQALLLPGTLVLAETSLSAARERSYVELLSWQEVVVKIPAPYYDAESRLLGDSRRRGVEFRSQNWREGY